MADLDPRLIGTKGKVGRPTAPNEPMNFKVSPTFRREFRMAAADRGLLLNELMIKAFDARKAERISTGEQTGSMVTQQASEAAARAHAEDAILGAPEPDDLRFVEVQARP